MDARADCSFSERNPLYSKQPRPSARRESSAKRFFNNSVSLFMNALLLLPLELHLICPNHLLTGYCGGIGHGEHLPRVKHLRLGRKNGY